MKQIFRIFAIAAVALSAAACQNDINDTIAPEGEGVSIRVTIADQTRVALGDFEEGKGYKLTFEEGDQLYIVNGWADSTEEGYYFDYTKQEDGTYTFTCTTEGVSSIVGDWKGVYYLGGRKNAIGAYGDTASESLNGVFMNGAGSIGSSTPIQLSVAPVLKLKSDYAVTISASNWIFCNGTKSYTTKTMGEWIYLAVNTAGTFEISASVLGEVVKSKTFELKENTIYNLGEIKPVEKEKDNANITIDGVFTDWDDVKTCVATVPEDVSYKDITLMKGYADNDYIYVYMEFNNNSARKLSMYVDPDYSNATGNTGNWGQNGSSVLMEGNIYNWNSDKTEQLEGVKYAPSANKYTGTDGANEWSWAGYWYGDNTNSSLPMYDEVAGVTKMEIAVVRSILNTALETTVSGNVGIGLILSNAGGTTIGRMPASSQGSSAASMLLIEVPAAE